MLSKKSLYNINENLWIFFKKYGFIRKIEPFHLRMKHIIQITAMAGLTVPYSINPILQYIFDCLGFNPMNGNFDFVFQGLNRLWMVNVTLILNGTVTLAIDRNGSSLLFLEEKWPNDATVPKSVPNSHSLWVHRLLNDDVWIC